MKSIREIYKIGRGPSSSHTIGPERAAGIFLKEYGDADAFKVKLYGSLSMTGKGHGTDRVITETLSPVPVEISFEQDMPADVTHPNTMDFYALKDGVEIGYMRALSIGGGDIRIAENRRLSSDSGKPAAGQGASDRSSTDIDIKDAYTEPEEVYEENSFAEVEEYCRFRNVSLAEYVVLTEGDEILEFLAGIWDRMKQTIQEGLEAEGILPGPLRVERKAARLYADDAADAHPQIRECRIISAYAYAVSEQNADCGTVVTAPTCGACGVLPAVLRYAQETRGLTDEQVVEGLAVAGLIGNLVKKNASISGAECGCQAEIGTACAMAAAALTTVYGLSTQQTQYAAEIALEHHLGLTCDPICGQVQVPCIERNAVAAMRAMNACNLSYFLADTQRISFDIVVKTMKETGININSRFRETSQGGLARMYGRRDSHEPRLK